jgi:hypothetical protein
LLRTSHHQVTEEHARYANKLILLLRACFPLHEGLFSTTVSQLLPDLILANPAWDSIKDGSAA